VPRTIETLPTPVEACSRILSLARPGEPIEVSLVEALGLVLAEPAIADVDLPPFDRALADGYALKASEGQAGGLLRVAGLRWANRSVDETLESGEAIRVGQGDPLPVGADAVVGLDDVRPDPATGPTRVIELLRGAEAGRGVARRGLLLEAGSMLAPAGTRLRASMVGLLASQGCVHPVCHRRVRVAVLAIGDHLVGPTEAPVMHRERNAGNAAIVAQILRAGAMSHDLQAVPESIFPLAFERATSAPVIVVLGPTSRPILKTLKSFGVEPIVSGVSMKPGGRTRHGVIRDDSGGVAHHVFHLPIAPIAASTAFALLVQPLIARLQGDLPMAPRTFAAVWDGTHRATVNHLRAVPVSLAIGADARQLARPIPLQGPDDLPGFARADGLALFPARSGPWLGGEVVEVVRFDRDVV
jgi:molybdopterin molybdotransferase